MQILDSMVISESTDSFKNVLLGLGFVCTKQPCSILVELQGCDLTFIEQGDRILLYLPPLTHRLAHNVKILLASKGYPFEVKAANGREAIFLFAVSQSMALEILNVLN